MEYQTFENWLQERFVRKNEVDGVGITKDNVEDFFSSWLENLDTQELMDLADSYGKIQHYQGQSMGLKTGKEIVANVLKN